MSAANVAPLHKLKACARWINMVTLRKGSEMMWKQLFKGLIVVALIGHTILTVQSFMDHGYTGIRLIFRPSPMQIQPKSFRIWSLRYR
jgi:hypothetical protein